MTTGHTNDWSDLTGVTTWTAAYDYVHDRYQAYYAGGLGEAQAGRERAVLENQRPKAARRLPLVTAALAIAVVLLASYLLLQDTAPPAREAPAGEPLKLKLEFAFPAARR